MAKRKPDKLDLKIAEIETRIATAIRHEIVQECLSRCKISSPGCPYLNSTKLCESIQDTVDTFIPKVFEDIGKDN